MRKSANDLFREKFGRDLPATDMRSPNYDYKAKLAERRAAAPRMRRYLKAVKKLYPGGSLST